MLPTVDVEVIGLKRSAKLEAMIDTGFAGYLCIPLVVAKEIGLLLCGEEKYELADGQAIRHYKFLGKVEFLGRTQEVEMLVTDSDTPLIGTWLMADCRLTIDFPTNKVRLTRKRN